MPLRRAFTLFEIIVSISLGVIIVGYAVIATVNLTRNRELELTANTLVNYLRTAQTRSVQSEGNASHGVRASAGSLTLFRGASYAARQTAYDTLRPYESYITISGLAEIVFAKQTGTPSATGTITVTNGMRSAVITVYASGAVSN